MLDYDKKYFELTKGITKCIDDISDEFPEASSFDKSVIALRRKRFTYADIQSKLGMPPKKEIRKTLLKWAPDLIDNPGTKEKEIINYLGELYYKVFCKGGNIISNIDGEDWQFYIKDKQLYYNDGEESLFEDLDYSTQAQIYNQIVDNYDRTI